MNSKEVNRYGFNSLPDFKELGKEYESPISIDEETARKWFIAVVENTKDEKFTLAEYKMVIKFLEKLIH